MFRHEWFKIRHNRRLLFFLVGLLFLNALYFWYHSERQTVPAHSYRALSADLRSMDDDEAISLLTTMKEETYNLLYMQMVRGNDEYPKYSDTLFTERELYGLKDAEYSDIKGYPQFLKKAAGAADEYRAILTLLGGDLSKLKDIEKTSKEYEALQGLTIRQTHTKGIAEALSLPSLIFLELLMAVLLISVIFTKDKEQGLLRMYFSMKAGRGRMFLTRMAAIATGCACCNLLFLLTTLLTGCLLYGMPVTSFLAQPIQSLIGYKQTVLRINIGTFLFLVYVWSCLVSIAVVCITAVVSSLVSSAMKVYIFLFTFIGVEGILYLRIDDLSYLAPFKRINLVSFADPGYTIARYHNEMIFGKPVSYPVVAFGILLMALIVFGALGYILSEKGIGVIPRRGRALRILNAGGTSMERSFGTHTRLGMHESVKYLRFERIGYILVLLAVLVVVTAKPYSNHYSTIEEMFYQSYLYRLKETEPKDYVDVLQRFEEEMEMEERSSSDPSSLQYKRTALTKIGDYIRYLQTKEGARAVDSRGYERLYNDRKQNVILGIGAILGAILCGTAVLASEYRTGMAGQIRISPRRTRVYLYKGLLLFGALVLVFAMIYGRYLFQILKGYGTEGIQFQANSIMDWSGYASGIRISGGIAILFLKRFAGMILCAAVAVFLTTRVKSFLLTCIVCIVVLGVPLLLCLREAGILSYIMANWFFL